MTPIRWVIVIATFVQCINYTLLGALKVRWRPGWLFTLTCFCIVEAYWALTEDPFMWCFVALNVVGIVSFLKGGV